MQNENKNHEMCKFLDCLHDNVPSVLHSSKLKLDDGTTINHQDYTLTQILLGGDQLTVSRAKSAKGMRINHEHSNSCLKGIIPAIED